MNKNEGQKLYNGFKKASIITKSLIPFSDVSKNHNQFMDFMPKIYLIEHADVINYMSDEKTKQMIAHVVPTNVAGYVQIFVKEENGAFQTYGIKFIPYRIIHKFWGLGFKDVNIKDFLFFECLYENDHTIFRGCFLN